MQVQGKATNEMRMIAALVRVLWPLAHRPDFLSKRTIARFGQDLQLLATEFVRHPRARPTSVPYSI